MSVRTALFIFLLPAGFALGWWAAPRAKILSSEGIEKDAQLKTDTIQLSASNSILSPARVGVSASSDLYNIETNRVNLEKTIRGVPFSFLKQIYLERQDQEWTKANLRYSRISPEDEQAQKKQTEELFNLFQKNSNGASYFMTSTEWTLRGGRRVPVTLLAQLYSSRTSDGSTTQADAGLATQGSELCYTASIYFKVLSSGPGHYASEGTGSCLGWPTVREGKPYVLFDNYAKQLTHLFDKVSAPLPGFGSDAEADPEWYDSTQQRWAPLPRLRWDPLSQEDYRRFEMDLNSDIDRS